VSAIGQSRYAKDAVLNAFFVHLFGLGIQNFGYVQVVNQLIALRKKYEC